MLTHNQIWTAMDRLAERAGLTASGLAKKAGLDPTTFNKSKRQTAEGRMHWPSTESVDKVLEATGATLDEFMNLVSVKAAAERAHPRVPLIGLAQAGLGRYARVDVPALDAPGDHTGNHRRRKHHG